MAKRRGNLGGGNSINNQYLSRLMELMQGQSPPSPGPTPLIDPSAAIRDANPFASFSNASARYGVDTNVKGDQFMDWYNSEGWADTQADYKASINRNPFQRTGQGGDMYSFINNQGQGLVDTLRTRYRALTPQQRGINSATGYKAGRWAVY